MSVITISLGDALKKIGSLIPLNNDLPSEEFILHYEPDNNEDAIVHEAVSILKIRVYKVKSPA